MTDHEKVLHWLKTKPLNLESIDKACSFNRGTCSKLRSGTLKGMRHLPILAQYFEKELNW